MSNGLLPWRKLVYIACSVALVLTGFIMALQMVSVRMDTLKQPDVRIVEKEVDGGKWLSKTRFEDIIDESAASAILSTYAKKFSKKRQKSDANPQKPETIRHWWEAAAMIDWYINSPIRYNCEKKESFGNWDVCQDAPFTVKPPCLVYSFGIANDFSFDDAMGKIGCEVHSFDPSMDKEDHNRSSSVTFHNMGLASISSNGFSARKDMYVTNEQKWKIRTLKSIMRELGHADRVIDVLKVDVEGHEWGVIDNLMETMVFDQVRQFMTEFHLFQNFPVREDYVYAYNVYRRLRVMGFREYSIGPHPKTLKEDDFNNQGDSEFVNAFFYYKPKTADRARQP